MVYCPDSRLLHSEVTTINATSQAMISISCVSLGGSRGSLIYSQYDGRAQKYNKLNGMPIFYNGNFSMKLINQLKQIGGKSSNNKPLTDTLL